MLQKHEKKSLPKLQTIAASLRSSHSPPKLSSFLTFQSVPATIGPHHNVKLKVGHGVIGRSDCSPPPNPWEMETK